jgi:CBS domain-containing protein
MKDIKVKEVMIPLEEYATVSEEATLYEAVLALERAQEKYLKESKPQVYPHRAILVLNSKGEVVGKISQFDVLKVLEPKYNDLITSDDLARTAASGFSREFLQTMLQQYKLFDQSLRDLCKKAARIKAKDCMYSPKQGGEFVKREDSLQVAVHQLVVGKHQSLLVTDNKSIVGILRLSDVFKVICQGIKSCSI